MTFTTLLDVRRVATVEQADAVLAAYASGETVFDTPLVMAALRQRRAALAYDPTAAATATPAPDSSPPAAKVVSG